VPSGLRSGTSSMRFMASTVAANAEAQIKIAYEEYVATTRSPRSTAGVPSSAHASMNRRRIQAASAPVASRVRQ
jgi:hypothetical protein